MPKFLPSLLRRPVHSLSITHKPQPLTVLLRLPYPFRTIYHHKSIIIHLFLPNKRKTKCVEQASSPASQSLPSRTAKRNTHKKQKIPEPWINSLPTYLHLPICKIIKLFNSNNLIQTISFLSFPITILSFSIPIFPFFLSIPFTLWRCIPKEVITKQVRLSAPAS